jgi:arsenate reductase
MRDYLVLFVGRENSGRTLMAEALVSRWGAPRFKAASAGLEPAAEIDPGAALALHDELHRAAQPPRLLSEVVASLDRKIDLVIALDPIESDLGVPGDPPVVRWHVDDPRLHEGGEKDRRRAWRGVLRDLEARVKLLASLLSEGLDEFLLRQRALDAARS